MITEVISMVNEFQHLIVIDGRFEHLKIMFNHV